jgi:type IX secretion system substrate protein
MRLAMKKVLLFMFLILFAGQSAFAGQTGKFTKNISYDGGTSKVYFYVPSSYNGANNPKMVVAMHPNDPAGGVIMQQMLESAADDNNFILVCPDDLQANGKIIQPSIDWTIDEYGINNVEIVMTGYSMGGTQTFTYASNHPEVCKGAIAIATAGPITQSAISQMAFAWICGTNDSYFSTVKNAYNQVKSAGGLAKFIEKPGVGHFGQYFYSPEFTTDWTECYNFLYDAKFPPAMASLVSPEDYTEDVEAPIQFVWTEQADADSYDFELYKGEDLVVEKNLANFKITHNEDLVNNSQYSWRVRANNSVGTGPWSQTWRFSTKMLPPEAKVVLTTPADGAEEQELDATLIWDEIEGIATYHVQVSDDNFETIVDEDENVSDNFGDPIEYYLDDLGQLTEYQWRVRGINTAGEGPWSDEFTFTTKSLLPTEKPVAHTPEDGAIDLAVDIRFVWDIVADASGYNFELYKKDEETPVVESDKGKKEIIGSEPKITLTLDNDLEYETEYRWTVSGKNEYGNGPWSEFRTFTTMEFVSVEDIDFTDAVKVYPNPTANSFKVELPELSNPTVNIHIYDLSGRLIQAVIGHNMSNSIDVSSMQTGEYIIMIDSDTKKYASKLLINK